MIAKTQKNIKNTWKIKTNTRKLLKIKRTHFFIQCCHKKTPKPYVILLIIYSINKRKEYVMNHLNRTIILATMQWILLTKKILKVTLTSDLGPIIKQDDYTFPQQDTVYNVREDFKEINDFKAFSKKIKGFCEGKALARVLSLIFVFMSNYAIAVCCCSCCFPISILILFSTLV